eukprot:TRINITY_DN24450_c0_g1_i1.p1 TRINITY_DN24450_c0_g1~~TRINITY_DN24450_c0_g1_i1.p1  ORF type:complete len:710 (-),score=206.06 TRINITY_DN24450_c0_g1_i1:81-2012(-)
MEQPVLDIPGDTSDSEEDDEDEEDNEVDNEEENLTGFAAKLARQAKLLRQKQAAAGGDDDDEEEEQKEKTAWGKSKKLYYSGDNVDYELQSSDEEAPAEEEAEALKLQKKLAESLRPEDFEQDEEESFDEALKVHGDKPTAKSWKGTKDTEENGMALEKISKDIHLLSRKEQMEVVMKEAPELVGLLVELREALDELRKKVRPLLDKVKSGNLATKDGLSYLEVKHQLLLSYCQAIVFYLMLKAEGKSVRDHPVITRLVEMRMFLEKIRPIDKKLQYQVDKLLKSADNSNGDETAALKDRDALRHRPNPSLLVSKLDADGQDAEGVYRPPMIAPTAMEEDLRPRDKRSRDRAEKEARRRSARSAFVKELANNLEGKPEEVREMDMESKEMMRERERLEARAREEEELFARVPLSKVERKKLKHLKRSRSGLMGMLDDFDDDVADLVGMDEANARKTAAGPPDDLLQSRKLSQIIAGAGHQSKRQRVVSGDADLPFREDIGDRRNKYDVKKSSKSRPDGGDERSDDAGSFEPLEDEFYQEAKELQVSKKAAKSAKYSREPPVLPVEDSFDGKRKISSQIEKNRGLTPQRKKFTKNPRKKYKVKHEKAVIRRKGQVRDLRTAIKPYAGEATGIRTNISRSVRMPG